MWKKHKIIMLPTEDVNAHIIKSDEIDYLILVETWSGKHQAQHLYILSDEKIKEGDWCYHPVSQKIKIADTSYHTEFKWKKIITTTDSIPQSFISFYIEEYNKGNKIEEIEIEYEDNGYEVDMGGVGGEDVGWMPKIELKIDSNNCINIKKIKEDWKRREVSNLIFKFKDTIAMELGISADEGVFEFKKIMNWINKNL